ncbi:hypothetical protein HYALB_00009160 [Hymenoscyphus albidus]|uniref:Rhodopsin domain-containing protein n=1 Tax=Hymenoscyphus albidus TaxID=595503 RepID=A0A9N9M2K3_9HELO|nr:hypothetical protein HYALB_00009160 [Hymenoscyphus albidus]
MLHHGGVHQWDLTLPEAQSALFWFNITSIEYGICMLTCKLTILTIYRRVFLPHHKTQKSYFHLILRVLEAILIAFYFSITVVKIFECNPRERIWKRSLPGTCININAMLNSSGMFNFITDVLILLVPVKSVWGLNMSRGKKVRVVAVFTFGLIAPVFSMIGFLARESIAKSPDVTYNQPLALLWAAAEITTGVICICLPPLSILFHRQKAPRGPTQSIINGVSNRSNKLNSATRASRRKGTLNIDDDDLLESGYLELQDGCVHEGRGPEMGIGDGKERMGENGWRVTEVSAGGKREGDGEGIGGRGGRDGKDIVKTVRVECSYE